MAKIALEITKCFRFFFFKINELHPRDDLSIHV